MCFVLSDPTHVRRLPSVSPQLVGHVKEEAPANSPEAGWGERWSRNVKGPGKCAGRAKDGFDLSNQQSESVPALSAVGPPGSRTQLTIFIVHTASSLVSLLCTGALDGIDT